jgi:hypothetical protein
MQTVNFLVEAALEDDEDSYHGVEIDFEKDLNRAVREIHRVIAWKITDAETGKSYYDPNALKVKQSGS